MWRALLAFAIVAVSVYVSVTSPPKLGLDLAGGTQLVYETQSTDEVKADAEATDRALGVLRGRVDALGVSEPTLTRSGSNRIMIELPGEQNPKQAEEVIGTTAQLTFHAVTGTANEQQLKQFQKTGKVDGSGSNGGSGGSGGDGGDGNNIPGQKVPDDQQSGNNAQNSSASSTAADSTADNVSSSAADDDNADKDGDSGEGGQDSGSQGDDDANSEGGSGSEDDSDDAAIDNIDPNKPAIMKTDQGDIIKLAPAALNGNDVTDATAQTPQEGVNQWVVAIDFNGEGGDKWEKLTTAAQQNPPGSPQRRVAIVLDGEVISSPEVQDGIQNQGSTQIEGNFSKSDADDLATLIKGGALPVPIKKISVQQVGPTLGDEAIDASFDAALIGIILTGLFILFVYRFVGLMATIALASYAAISYALLAFLGATLTLPGLAGFVLSIGMAIDANVLIFERAREEYEKRRGEGLGPALKTGYKMAWSAIIDSNITTLLAGALLFFLAFGPVKGFGVTLSFGVIASMISALLIARVLTDWLVRRSWVRKRPNITGIAGVGRVRSWLGNSGIKVMRHSTKWLVVTAAITILSIGGIVIRGMDLGVEFSGGREIEFSSSQPIDVDKARVAVSDAGFPQAVVQETGATEDSAGGIKVRTDEISTDEVGEIQEAVSSVGQNVKRQEDRFIEPTLGEELRDKALIAFGVAVATQMVYLAFRFRWTWALAAVLAMVHDVLAVVGIFTWWGKPIDGVFLAAILSIIGLSVNDTIVVFDRIREGRKLEPDRSLSDIASESVLHTLPRTINTGIGAMFILVALAVLGGSSLTDFSLALIFGLTIGTYSSIFAASPLALLFEKLWPVARAEERKKKRVDDPYANVAAAGRESGEL